MKQKLKEGWFHRAIDPDTDMNAAGIYQWSIEGVGIYVGKAKVLRTRLPAYSRNVLAMIEKRPWHGNPTKHYRAIHEELRKAYDNGVLVTLTVLENCDPAIRAERERHWIRVRRDDAGRDGPKVLNAN